MKKLFGLAIVSMMAVAASAQITWNAKGGLGVATCYGGDTGDLQSHFVGKLGAGIEKPLSKNWSLMPSLEVALKGTEYKDGSGFKETLDVLYIQVPVVAAYRINISDSWNTAFKLGPYFAFDVYDRYKNSYVGEVELDLKKFDVGLDAGIDFEHHRFVFGVEAEWGFIPLFKFDEKVGPKNLALYATVGWKF